MAKQTVGKPSLGKGERTREQLIEQAAALFNQQGYQSASIRDIMAATGLEKGGVYRHFKSKDELAMEAFRFAISRMRERFAQALGEATTARDRLRAIVGVYARIPVDPPVPGGCPLLNAAVEADDAHPALRREAEAVMKDLVQTLRGILRNGKKSGELSPELDVDASAHVLIAQLEGAVMMAKLSGSLTAMRHTVAHLERWIAEL